MRGREPGALKPTSHLDLKNQTLVLGMIKRLAAEGLTIVMASHFPNHVFALAGRVALMGRGGFIAVGRPAEVLTEENLSLTYGMAVRVFSIPDPKGGAFQHRFCVPALESPGP